MKNHPFDDATPAGQQAHAARPDRTQDWPFRRRRALALGGLLAAGSLLTGWARADGGTAAGSMDHGGMDHGGMDHSAMDHSAMDHSGHGSPSGQPAAAHQHAAPPPGIKRSEAVYRLPEVRMVRQDGARVMFPREIDDGRPVILDFIYTSCTEICPVTSQVFSELQQRLGAEREKVHMVSVSIDPEYDTPARLTAYAKKFSAGSQWQHYTGSLESSLALQRAFDVYRGDKMNHFPVTFLRAAPGAPWVRLEGFATPDLLAREYRDLPHGARDLARG